jgi:hypothetical protein
LSGSIGAAGLKQTFDFLCVEAIIAQLLSMIRSGKAR